MNISLEQIELLRKKADIGYKEAKETLEKFNGDMVEALAYLEEQKKLKPEGSCIKNSSFFKKIKNLIAKGNKIKFVISKEKKTILNIPLTLGIVATIVCMPVVVATVVIALLTSCKIRFEKENSDYSNINDTMEKVSNAVTNVTSKITEEIKNA